MKNKLAVLLLVLTTINCTRKTVDPSVEIPKKEPMLYLPFKTMDLKKLNTFQKTSDNWQIAWKAFIDRTRPESLQTIAGTGVLVNLPTKAARENLFTNFEHGDIELELNVMLPKGSNSGLYLQGRYEVQLLDSWGTKDPKYGDMGGIYQRWDPSRGIENEGYEGVAPRINAAKAPGLWQHFKIIFHAPRFDDYGIKIENARFEEIWLNGVLIHENISLSGPTAGAVYPDERFLGPLMIQGDHGAVAFKDIKYKLFDNKKIALSNMSVTAYDNKEVLLPVLDSLVPRGRIKTDSLSAQMVGEGRPQTILKFAGNMNIPDTGEYLFDFKLNGAGGLLLIDTDTVVDLNGDYNLDSLGYGKAYLQKGKIPFTLIYNKHRPWTKGFSLEVEGPGMQKHPLHAPGSLDLSRGGPKEDIKIEVTDESVVQRSFLMHKGVKRTHCISVGTPQRINYSYDLAYGTLLKAWDGEFLDATQMWHSRGEKQLGRPAGFTIDFHGSPQFAFLKNENESWPHTTIDEFKLVGYEFDALRNPVFSYDMIDSNIEDKLIPMDNGRGLERLINSNSDRTIWHKLSEGETIEKLPDGSYIINNESYFVDFFNGNDIAPIIRTVDGRNELLIKIPPGPQKINYNIIW